ncbi:MAG: M56 family metallopeptidase [Gammaproteobacteria bacterium]|nr:M56 family metallopeptidase [Gammaproteobacteria bacterium]
MEFLTNDSMLSVREGVTVMLLTGLLTLASTTAFPRNAATRQIFMLLAVMVTVLLPLLLRLGDVGWALAMRNPPVLILDVPLPRGLLVVWLSIAALLTGRQLIRHVLVSRRVAALPIIAERRIATLMRQLKERLGVDRDVVVRKGLAPCSTTVGPATIVIPSGYRDWSENTLRAVLAHELVHVRRKDDRWMLCVRLVVDVYWWMPWLRWFYARYLDAMEESCDDRASQLFTHEVGYLDGVIEVARRSLARPLPGLPSLDQHHLVTRIGRFGAVRDLQLDTPKLYWLMLVLIFVVVLITSVHPVQLGLRSTAATPVQVADLPGALDTDLAVYGEVSSSIANPPTRGGIAAQLRTVGYEPTPIYPGKALRKGIQGDVLIEYSVTADGGVVRPHVVTSHPPGVFDDAAVQAMHSTRYPPIYKIRPGQVPGLYEPPAEQVRIRKHFRFRLRNYR